jgi:hypothetical protein
MRALYLTFCIPLLLISGCTSLSKDVFERVRDGDTEEVVVHTLGQPDTYTRTDGGVGPYSWYYRRRADVCEIAFESHVVRTRSCPKDTAYIGPIGTLLKGAGEGLTNQHRGPTCYTNGTVVGNQYNGTTNCN